MKLITIKLKLKDIIDKKTVKSLSGYGVTKDSEFLRKGLEVSDVIFEEGERAAISVITTSRPDRDRDIVRPDGIILDHFLKHPVVLAGHDYSDTVGVGMAVWIKQTDDGSGLISKTKYHDNAKADEIWKWRKAGFPMAVSIGFIPLEGFNKGERGFNQHAKDMIAKGWITKEHLDATDRIFTKSVLLEYSDVLVPSNPEALQIAVSKNFMPGEGAPYMIEDCDPVLDITDYQDKPGVRKFVIIDKALTHNDGATITELQISSNVESPEDYIDTTQTKTIDADKQPSVRDIENAIFFTLNNNSLVNDSHSHIIDLYPVEYPNGHAVIAMFIENVDGSISQQRFVDWQYTMMDDIATLTDAEEVTEQWAVKGLTEELKTQLGVKVQRTIKITPSPKKKTVTGEEAIGLIKTALKESATTQAKTVAALIADAQKEMTTKIALAKGHVVYKE